MRLIVSKKENFMLLTFNDIKKITVGAVKISEESDGIHFYKCTEKQIKAWDKLRDVLGVISLSTTGI